MTRKENRVAVMLFPMISRDAVSQPLPEEFQHRNFVHLTQGNALVSLDLAIYPSMYRAFDTTGRGDTHGEKVQVSGVQGALIRVSILTTIYDVFTTPDPAGRCLRLASAKISSAVKRCERW